jgi:hypothetical protein
MSKKFDIHDWQAKQAKKRLNESDKFGFASGDNYIPDDVDSQGRNTWGDKVGYANNQIKDKIVQYIDHTFASWMSPDNPPISKEYSKGSPYFDKLIRGIMGILPARMSEHHAGEYEPDFLKQSVNTFLDKLKKKTNEGSDYETVEKIMEKHFSAKKEVDEVSVGAAGPGATSVDTSGRSVAYTTKNAFKKKTKKD